MDPLELLKRLFELTLWSSRLIVLVAVVFGIILALGAFYLATIDVFCALRYLSASTRTPPWGPKAAKV